MQSHLNAITIVRIRMFAHLNTEPNQTSEKNEVKPLKSPILTGFGTPSKKAPVYRKRGAVSHVSAFAFVCLHKMNHRQSIGASTARGVERARPPNPPACSSIPRAHCPARHAPAPVTHQSRFQRPHVVRTARPTRMAYTPKNHSTTKQLSHHYSRLADNYYSLFQIS